MGNLFLGFPVARAKIADMIATSAPPSLHKTQHQLGGSDALDVTGLTGAGGGGIALGASHSFNSTFESLSGYEVVQTGTGVVTLNKNGILLDTGSGAGGVASIKKTNPTPSAFLSWNRKRAIAAIVRFTVLTDTTYNFSLFNGGSETSKHVGFYGFSGALYASVGNGTTVHQEYVASLFTTPVDSTLSLAIVYTPGVDAKFYVDNVLAATISDTLPSGSPTADEVIFAEVKNLASAAQKTMTISTYQITVLTP